MKLAVLGFAAALLLQGAYEREGEVDAAPERFRYERALQVPASTRGQACTVLDAEVYMHSSGRIDELRIYSAGHEVPFVRTESREAGQQEEPARVMNLGRRDGNIVFDLGMPQRSYTEVVLDLDGRNFYATAKVWGEQAVGGPRTELGDFVLFDLEARGLSRSTVLALQESSFPVLHVEMKLTAAPGGDASALTPSMVRGASVPPSREAQVVYTTVAATSDFATRGRETLATLALPAHLPVERVRFDMQPGFEKNFSRAVKVTARVAGAAETEPAETLGGEIKRVRLPSWLPESGAHGHAIRSEQMSVEALLGANLRSDAVVSVAVENGDDAPLPLRAVQLQMRQRKLCFEAEPGAVYVLRYGDAQTVRAPVYDYAHLFRASAAATVVGLGAEVMNPQFHEAAPPAARKAYSDRHPELLWVALLVVIGVLGTVALHNTRRVARKK